MKIVTLPTALRKKARYDAKSDQDYMAFLGAIRDYVNKAMEYRNLTHKDVAEMLNRSPRTISNFCEGVTVSPQFPTVVGILGAIDAHLEIVNQRLRLAEQRVRRHG